MSQSVKCATFTYNSILVQYDCNMIFHVVDFPLTKLKFKIMRINMEKREHSKKCRNLSNGLIVFKMYLMKWTDTSKHHTVNKGLLGSTNRFKHATLVCLFHARTWISNVNWHGLFYFQWFKVRGDCSCCWYWWNCWPSLLKLSFHKFYIHMCCYHFNSWHLRSFLL